MGSPRAGRYALAGDAAGARALPPLVASAGTPGGGGTQVDRDGWIGIMAEEQVVPAHQVRSLAAAARELGVRRTPADRTGAGSPARLMPWGAPGRPPAGEPSASPRRLLWGRFP